MSIAITGAHIVMTRRPALKDRVVLPAIHGIQTVIRVALGDFGSCAIAHSEDRGAVAVSQELGAVAFSEDRSAIAASEERGVVAESTESGAIAATGECV